MSCWWWQLQGSAAFVACMPASCAQLLCRSGTHHYIMDRMYLFAQVDTQDWSAVHSVASCTVGDTALLVLGNGSGLQVWDERGAILLYQWQLPPSAPPAVGAAPPSHGGFVRGIAFCVVADGSVQLCAGSSSGTIHTFSVTEGPVIRPSRRVEGHTVPLLALGSSYQSRRGCWAEDLGCELVSSDERGQLAVWAARKTGEHEVVGAIDGGVPACALAVRCGFLVAGRVDGSVRIYGLVRGCGLSGVEKEGGACDMRSCPACCAVL